MSKAVLATAWKRPAGMEEACQCTWLVYLFGLRASQVNFRTKHGKCSAGVSVLAMEVATCGSGIQELLGCLCWRGRSAQRGGSRFAQRAVLREGALVEDRRGRLGYLCWRGPYVYAAFCEEKVM
jgi:hypothetical protein